MYRRKGSDKTVNRVRWEAAKAIETYLGRLFESRGIFGLPRP